MKRAVGISNYDANYEETINLHKFCNMQQKPGGAWWLGFMQEEVVWSEECPPSHVAPEPSDQSVSASLVLSEYHQNLDVSTNNQPDLGTIKEPTSGHVTRVTSGTFSDHDRDDPCCQTHSCEGKSLTLH